MHTRTLSPPAPTKSLPGQGGSSLNRTDPPTWLANGTRTRRKLGDRSTHSATPRSALLDGRVDDGAIALLDYGRDPEADAVPGLTRDRNSRSEGRRSMCSAIHITSRTWLRPSSTREPSDPPLRVVLRSPGKRATLGIELSTIEASKQQTTNGAERPPEGRRHIERGANITVALGCLGAQHVTCVAREFTRLARPG